MITPVCQIFGVFPSFHATWLTLVNLRTPCPFNAFNISGRISSSPAAFSDFNPRMAAATSVNVKTSSFPKSIVSHVSVGVALTGCNKSSKYSLQRERISFSSRRMAAFRASKYRDCKSDDGLLCNKGLKRIFCCSDSFFNILVPPRRSFLTVPRHSKPLSSTAFNS